MSIELLLTFIFVTVILMVAIDNKSKTNLAPIYIGIALCVCILASLVYKFVFLDSKNNLINLGIH
jgi:glycerol uptake facilitator-like aquaporin